MNRRILVILLCLVIVVAFPFSWSAKNVGTFSSASLNGNSLSLNVSVERVVSKGSQRIEVIGQATDSTKPVEVSFIDEDKAPEDGTNDEIAKTSGTPGSDGKFTLSVYLACGSDSFIGNTGSEGESGDPVELFIEDGTTRRPTSTTWKIRCDPSLNNSWDWEGSLSELLYCFDAGVANQGGVNWKQKTKDATAVWNSAGSDWKFKITNKGKADEGAVTTDCRVKIAIKDHNKAGGAYIITYFVHKPSGSYDYKHVKIGVIEIDATNPVRNDKSGNTTWGDTGDKFNPQLVIMHELSHALRLDHPTRTYTSSHVADPRAPGNHTRTLSGEDKQEAKDSAKRTITPISIASATTRSPNEVVRLDAGDVGGAGASVTFPEGAVPKGTLVSVRPVFGAFPSPFSTFNPELVRVFMGVEISAEPNIDSFSIPVTVEYYITDASILSDPNYVGPESVINLETLMPVVFDPASGTWEYFPDEREIDVEARILTFQVRMPGLYGITGFRVSM